jgi:hypothetical protein
MTWHQWHHTAVKSSKMGLFSAWARAKVLVSQSYQSTTSDSFEGWRCFTLRLNVLLDDLIRHIARTCSEIASGPQVSSSELPAQLAKLLQQFPTTASFDTLHQVAH